MKKLITTLCVFASLALTACNNTNNGSKADGQSKGSNESQPASTDSYQLWGKLEEGGSFASFTDAAFLLNLEVDGKTTLDKYNFASYDASPAASNKSYIASYMSGTWKAVQKEGVDALQIKLAFIEEDGSESGASTYYAYESDGVYSVDLTVALIKGQSFTRTVEMEGQKGKKYADADAFIQAYKKDFVEPESVVRVESTANGGVAYFQEDGKVLIYVGTNNIASGTYVKTATSLTLKIDDKEIPVTLTREKATFSYTYDLAGYQQIELVFEMPIADFGKLPVTEQGGGTPVDENVVLEMKDETNGATLTFNKDKTYKINMDFGNYGSFAVQKGAWSFASYKVTLTPENGTAFESKVENGKFIVETHITWGGGQVDTDVHFEAEQTVIGKFMAA
jgi:predicted small secreted protein